MPGLNDCDRIGRCDYTAGHYGPCSSEVQRVGDVEFCLKTWDGLNPHFQRECDMMRDCGWERVHTLGTSGGTVILFCRNVS